VFAGLLHTFSKQLGEQMRTFLVPRGLAGGGNVHRVVGCHRTWRTALVEKKAMTDRLNHNTAIQMKLIKDKAAAKAAV
jgi:hypothetical protein